MLPLPSSIPRRRGTTLPLVDSRTAAALARYEGLEGASVASLGHGLINDTYRVESARGTFVLQRVNPIFGAAVHDNIQACTAGLARAGVATPELVRARDGALAVTLEDGAVFRVLTFVAGASFDVAESLEQVRSAAALIGRFHAALARSAHCFTVSRVGVHDTARHMARLDEALTTRGEHRLSQRVRPLGEEVLAEFAALSPLGSREPVIGHGDLKLNNVLFAGTEPGERDRAVCLVDLDTVGPIALGHELGDMWRSWCNPLGEDAEQGAFELPIFEASLHGYVAGRGAPFSDHEREALLVGVEHIALELAARFLADALFESYFGFDSERYATRGEHNLVRGRGQLALYRATVACREERARLLAQVP